MVGIQSAPDVTADQRRILIVAVVPLFMALLSVSIVNVVLPSIRMSIGASTAGIQWVLTGYTLTFGVLLVPAGRAGDLYGRAKLFVLGVGLFGLGSLVAGLAPDEIVLNVARALMGCGSGFINPQTVGLIQQYFQGEQRAWAFGAFGSAVGVSVAIGPVLGGSLVAMFGADWGWRLSFLINVPIAVVAIITAVSWLPASAWRTMPRALGGGTVRERPSLDPVGIVLLASATLAIMLPFLQADTGPWIWTTLPLGVLVLILWLRWERRYKSRGRAPMVDLALFRIRAFANGSLLIGLYFMGMTSIWVVIAIFLQTGLGYTALQAGLVGLPSAICSAISAAVAGRYVIRLGRKIVLYGIALLLLGLAASGAVIILNDTIGSSIWWLLLTLSLVGLGQGSAITPNQTLALMDVPLPYAGSAGGIMQTGQRLGTAIGLAIITALFFATRSGYGSMAGILVAFSAIGVIIAASGVVGIVDWLQERRASHRSSA